MNPDKGRWMGRLGFYLILRGISEALRITEVEDHWRLVNDLKDQEDLPVNGFGGCLDTFPLL